jgi:hypothetical protein
MAYEERYCAFVDILGFSRLVTGMRGGAIHFETIRGLLQKIYSPYDPQFVGMGNTDFRAQSISDAVAFSTLRTPEGLSVLCAAIRELALALLYQGYFTRGAVCKGLLYHDDKMVFGEALIKAYTLESTVAKYPRIMLTKDVVDDAQNSELKNDFVEHIRQADDGPFYLHVLWRLRMILDLYKDNPMHAGSERSLDYYAIMQRMIQQRFEESVDTPKHFEKVQWFARYWNSSIIRIRNEVGPITGPGL